ncbi:ABC-three component system protein [Streptomonospora alba]|uniref:ABC-three component system protein n=1 Tax=Streptomonospora alba TaxID=183763 RepID=UPI0014706BFE|nr:ABC-three component system protein [Streptomonospora alba]
MLEVDDVRIKLSDWRRQLGNELFGLEGSDFDPSYRSLISFYLRDVANGGFANPTETHSKQSKVDTLSTLAHLFSLDTGLVSQVKELREAEKSLKDLKKAARDPVLGMTLGRAQDLDAQIRTLDIERETLQSQISNFQVVDRYSENRKLADQLSKDIRSLNDKLVMDGRRLSDIEQSIEREDSEQLDYEYLRDVYDNVGITLPGSVIRRFEQVTEFHRSVVNNRRRYLDSERASLAAEIDADRMRLAELDRRRGELMRLLESGGALETYNQLQQELGAISGRISELQERRAVVDRWENSNRHLQLRSAELEMQVSNDLTDRASQIERIADTFASFAYALYGSRRPSSLAIEPSKSGYTFSPFIGGDASEGVRSMAMFCFDLTMAVTAKRNGRGPDFLVHDSHLYDGVEGRQLANALKVASEAADNEGLQYIVCLNSDDLQKAFDEGFDVSYHEAARMTDKYDNGGLFGIRFQ